MSEVKSDCAVRAAIQESGPAPAVGQIWKEVDPRVTREIEILQIDDDFAIVRTVGGSRETVARLARFNGKRDGYMFMRNQ